VKAYCKDCGALCELGFQAIISFSNYEVDINGQPNEIVMESLNPDWGTGAEVEGFLCVPCDEWLDSDDVDIQ